jgi:hypothetical protein
MIIGADREVAPVRPRRPSGPAAAVCPVCGLRVGATEHAVHIRRGTYHAACLLYRGRGERDRWRLGP